MDYKSLITELYAGIKKRPEVKAVIPMGYVPGYPVLTIRNEQLIVAVPFLRYKQTGEIDPYHSVPHTIRNGIRSSRTNPCMLQGFEC